MAHYGVLSIGSIGHLNPLCVLGREMQQRGHKVTYFGIPDVQQKINRAGLNYRMIGERLFPLGRLAVINKQLGIKKGLDGLKYSLNWFKQNAAVLFEEGPGALKDTSVEALIIDQTAPAGITVAEYLEIPYVITCTGLLLNREAGVPPFFTSWSYSRALGARMRNHLTNFFLDKLISSLRNYIVAQRKQWGLSATRKKSKRGANYLYEKQLAQISQMPQEFDFPRLKLPDCFHYTGPFIDSSGLEPTSSLSLSFPFEKLNNKPLVYASLGTLQNWKREYFEIIAEACSGLDIQLVISLGRTEMEPLEYDLDNAVVVPFAPHQKLIKKSSLVITHAGLNTVLGALAEAIPLVAIPITNEQPGIAARIKRCGVGEIIPVAKLDIEGLRKVIRKVLAEDSYKKNAEKMKDSIDKAGGVKRAADIVEQAIAGNELVLSELPEKK